MSGAVAQRDGRWEQIWEMKLMTSALNLHARCQAEMSRSGWWGRCGAWAGNLDLGIVSFQALAEGGSWYETPQRLCEN